MPSYCTCALERIIYFITLPHHPTALPPQLAMAIVLATVASFFVFVVSVSGPYVFLGETVAASTANSTGTETTDGRFNGLFNGANASCVVPDMGGLEDLRGRAKFSFWRVLQSIAIPQVMD